MTDMEKLRDFLKPSMIKIYAFVIVSVFSLTILAPFLKGTIELLMLIAYCYIYSAHVEKKIIEKEI